MPNQTVVRQVVWNRVFEKILEFETPDEGYIDPYTAFDKHESLIKEPITYDNTERFSPFLELCILRDDQGSFSSAVSFHSYDDLSTAKWRHIRDIVRSEIKRYEVEMAGTRGKLFYPFGEEREFLDRKREAREHRRLCAIRIRDRYELIMAEIKELLQTGAEPEAFSAKYGVPVEKVRQSLWSPKTREPTPSQLARLISADSDEARELGYHDGDRLYDDVIARTPGKESRKSKGFLKGKRWAAHPLGHLQDDTP